MSIDAWIIKDVLLTETLHLSKLTLKEPMEFKDLKWPFFSKRRNLKLEIQ